MNRVLYLVMLVLLYGSLGGQSQQVIMGGSPLPSNLIVNNYPADNKLTDKKGPQQYDGATMFDGLQVASSDDRNSLNPVAVLEERTGITDMAKYMGNYVYRGAVRRMLVKPMVRGFKRLIPGSMYSYYNEVLATKRVFKMISPLRPALSSYAYNKFEQGVFWSLKRSWRFAVDNFVEFEEKR